MKNVKRMLLTITAMLLLGIGSVYSQEQPSVIVSLSVSKHDVTIETINPDYSIDKKSYSDKEENISVVLKKELDSWILKGFEIKESTSVPYSPGWYTVSYFLVKKE
mgnify:CR=1 FL=1